MLPLSYTDSVPRKARANPATEWSKWVVAARAATGLSQTDFGDKIGKSKGSVTDWERAENKPELESVARIVKTFKDVPPPPLANGVISQALGSTELSAPASTVTETDATGGYAVKYIETEVIAKRLDAIEDEDLRAEAMEACSAKIRELLHPSRRSVERGPGHTARK